MSGRPTRLLWKDQAHNGYTDMRVVAALLGTVFFVQAALAVGWMEYRYPDAGFVVMFPSDPTVQTTSYDAVDGRSVPARTWTVTTSGSQLKITVADISNTGLQEADLIGHFRTGLTRAGEITADAPHRIGPVYGREFSTTNRDGSREKTSVFDFNNRLYVLDGKVLPGGDDTDLILFEQTLLFTDHGSNRDAEWIRKLNAACPKVNGAAGPDDPNCSPEARLLPER